jgi:hypothetical protein
MQKYHEAQLAFWAPQSKYVPHAERVKQFTGVRQVVSPHITIDPRVSFDAPRTYPGAVDAVGLDRQLKKTYNQLSHDEKLALYATTQSDSHDALADHTEADAQRLRAIHPRVYKESHGGGQLAPRLNVVSASRR